MPFFTAATIAGIAAAGAGVAGSAIASHAAGKAADTQSKTALSAADLERQDSQAALAEQKRQFDINQQNQAPWLSTGKDALSQLWSQYKSGAFGDFTDKFTAPTMQDAQNDPAYQFGLDQGTGILQNSAAAKGKLFSGNTQEALSKFANDYASTKYTDVYNRALGQYQQNYNIFENNQTNSFNRLAALSGIGQQAATTLGTQGQQEANNVSNILLTSGQQQANQLNNAAAARASGYVGSANAWGAGITGGTNNLALLALLNSNGGGGGTGNYGEPLNYGISSGQYPT